jgi:hypothetical protein
MENSPFEGWFLPRYPSASDTTIEIRFADVEGGKYRLRGTVLAGGLNELPRKVRLGPVEDIE